MGISDMSPRRESRVRAQSFLFLSRVVSSHRSLVDER